jgi:hypothetical protein
MSNKKQTAVIKKNCYNCEFSSSQFKIVNKNHVHCHNEIKYPKEEFENGNFSAWDTLREWWDKCDKHLFKEKYL